MFAAIVAVSTYLAVGVGLAIVDSVVTDEFDVRDTVSVAALWPVWLIFAMWITLCAFLGGTDDDYYREDY